MPDSLTVMRGRLARVIQDDPLAQFLSGQLAERTRKAYYADLCEFFDGDRITPDDVHAITFADIIEYRNSLAALGRKRTTINRKLASLKAFFRMMVATGVIDKNPADSTLVKGYRVDDAVSGKSLTRMDLQRILDAAGDEQDELRRARDLAILHLLTFGGLRRSEIANISWGDFGEDGAFQILHLPETKSGVAQDIKLQPLVLHYLHDYRQTLEQHRHSVQGKVFISLSRNQSHGSPITDQSINLIVRRYAKRGCGRSIARRRQLKTAYLTLYLREGAVRIGHKRISTLKPGCLLKAQSLAIRYLWSLI